MDSIDPAGRVHRILIGALGSTDVSPFVESLETNVDVDTRVLSGREELSDALLRGGDGADAPQPDLVVLWSDESGAALDVLAELDERPAVRRIPILVVSSTDASDDITEGYTRGANAYIETPTSDSEFETLAEALTAFWLRTSRLPPTGDRR